MLIQIKWRLIISVFSLEWHHESPWSSSTRHNRRQKGERSQHWSSLEHDNQRQSIVHELRRQCSSRHRRTRRIVQPRRCYG